MASRLCRGHSGVEHLIFFARSPHWRYLPSTHAYTYYKRSCYKRSIFLCNFFFLATTQPLYYYLFILSYYIILYRIISHRILIKSPLLFGWNYGPQEKDAREKKERADSKKCALTSQTRKADSQLSYFSSSSSFFPSFLLLIWEESSY